MFMLVMFDGHLAVEPSPIHGIGIGIENYTVQVPHDDSECGQDRFIPVDGQGDIDPPSWYTITDTNLEPGHQSGAGHHKYAPHQGPVLGFFGIRKTGEQGTLLAITQVVAERVTYICDVLPVGQHVFEEAAAVGVGDEVPDVIEAHHNHHDACGAVHDAAHCLVDKDHGQPRRWIVQGKAGHHQNEEADQQREMLDTLRHCHAEEDSRLPDAAQDRLLAEDDQVVQHHAADDRYDHPDIELADDGDDLAAEIGFRSAVRVHLEADELFVCAGMALAASFRQVGMIDGGMRVRRGQNVVHSVATGAIGHRARTYSRCHPVIAGQVGTDASSGDAEFR